METSRSGDEFVLRELKTDRNKFNRRRNVRSSLRKFHSRPRMMAIQEILRATRTCESRIVICSGTSHFETTSVPSTHEPCHALMDCSVCSGAQNEKSGMCLSRDRSSALSGIRDRLRSISCLEMHRAQRERMNAVESQRRHNNGPPAALRRHRLRMVYVNATVSESPVKTSLTICESGRWNNDQLTGCRPCSAIDARLPVCDSADRAFDTRTAAGSQLAIGDAGGCTNVIRRRELSPR